MKKKLILRISVCLAAVVLLFVGCSFSSGFRDGGFLPRIDTVSAADDVVSQEEIDKLTRYPIMSNADFYSDITAFVNFMYGDPLGDVADVVQAIKAIRNNRYKAPVSTSLDVYKKLVDYANASSDKSYIIANSACFMAKRTIKYPYNSWQETDYLIVYVDDNSTTYNTQQFGDYLIVSNSMLLVRQTNFMGVKVVSIPMKQNNIGLYYNISGFPCVLFLGDPPNLEYTFDTAHGPVVHSFRTPFSNPNVYNSHIGFTNNSENTIVDNWLIEQYQTNKDQYLQYIDDNTWLDDVEVLLGNGYNDSYYQVTLGSQMYTRPWYFSYAYFNTVDNDPSYLTNNFNNNITNVINPKNPPAYIVPNDSPFKSGKTINNTTVNNYNDYGITYDNDTNQFELDIDALAAALGAAITPEFQGLFDGTFELQPEIGANFDNSPSLDFNYTTDFDLSIDNLFKELFPDYGGGGGSWEPPTYPSVNTSTYIPASVPSYETYVMQTVPDGVLSSARTYMSLGWDLFDGLGLVALVIPLALLGILWKFTGG